MNRQSFGNRIHRQTDWLRDSLTTANMTVGSISKEPKAGITIQCLAFWHLHLKLSLLLFIQYLCLAQKQQGFTIFFISLNVLIFKKYNVSCKRAHFFFCEIWRNFDELLYIQIEKSVLRSVWNFIRLFISYKIYIHIYTHNTIQCSILW